MCRHSYTLLFPFGCFACCCLGQKSESKKALPSKWIHCCYCCFSMLFLCWMGHQELFCIDPKLCQTTSFESETMADLGPQKWDQSWDRFLAQTQSESWGGRCTEKIISGGGVFFRLLSQIRGFSAHNSFVHMRSCYKPHSTNLLYHLQMCVYPFGLIKIRITFCHSPSLPFNCRRADLVTNKPVP